MRSEKLKIAFLDYSDIFAGAERVLHSYISNFDSDKFEPILIFPYPKEHHKSYGNLNCKKEYLVDKARYWMGRYYWDHPVRGADFLARTIWGWKLAAFLKKNKVDILHVNLLRPDCLMWILPSKMSGIKIVGHVRSHEDEWVSPGSVQKCCDVICYVSDYCRSRNTKNGEKVHCETLYDSIDIESLHSHLTKQEAKRLFGVTYDSFLISSVGQLCDYKGHDNAIKAFGMIADKYDKSCLLIAGGGDEEYLKYLEGLANSYPDEISGRIKFTRTQISNVSDLYRASDLVLSLSKGGEAFGLVPYEAALIGTPFIGPNLGAITEFVASHDNGLLVDTENFKTIADEICWAIDHPRECHDMVKKLSAIVIERLTPQTAVRNLEQIYCNLINGQA